LPEFGQLAGNKGGCALEAGSRPLGLSGSDPKRHSALAMLSFPHLVVLFVIALVIFGPEKLPELARMLGKATSEFRKMTNDFRYALEDEVRDLDRQNRIREQESALAASRAAQAAAPSPDTEPSAAPENAVAREIPSTVVTAPIEPPPTESAPAEPSPTEPSNDASAAPSAEPAAAPQPPEAVSVPHEKSPDDNSAV
jgi:sec-independent protein translocase protein TatB